MAQAAVAGTIHVVKKRRWEYTQDGQKHLIEVDKRLKQWWTTQMDGTILLSVRYGAKRFEFEKGKDAIAIKSVDELVLVLRKLIDATDGGEFDAMIAAANKDRPIVTKRA